MVLKQRRAKPAEAVFGVEPKEVVQNPIVRVGAAFLEVLFVLTVIGLSLTTVMFGVFFNRVWDRIDTVETLTDSSIVMCPDQASACNVMGGLVRFGDCYICLSQGSTYEFSGSAAVSGLTNVNVANLIHVAERRPDPDGGGVGLTVGSIYESRIDGYVLANATNSGGRITMTISFPVPDLNYDDSPTLLNGPITLAPDGLGMVCDARDVFPYDSVLGRMYTGCIGTPLVCIGYVQFNGSYAWPPNSGIVCRFGTHSFTGKF